MINSTEWRQKILEILQESAEPVGPTTIAKKLRIERNKVHYHLKKLKDDALIISPEEGKYSINKDEMEILREIETKILHLLSSKEYYPKELQQELSHNESKILSAIHLLESYGLIKEGQTSLEKRGGIPRKGLVSNVSDHLWNSTFTPTYLGYSKIGFCPICKNELNVYETVVVILSKTSYLVRPQAWVSVKIHSKCLPNSKAYEMTYGKSDTSMFCSHCGLPLSPKILPECPITYKTINNHFLGVELESIRLLENLEQSWVVPLTIPINGVKFGTTPQNSTIKKVYKKFSVNIPEWLAEKIKSDENDPEKVSFKKISWEISNDFNYIFHRDISTLENAEKFIKLLMKYSVNFPANYDIDSRIRDVWTAAQEIKKIYVRNVRESYEKLLGPEANLYSFIDWAFDVENFDFDRVRSDYTYEMDDSSVFSQIFAIKCGNDYFHPYCADKLGLNENHCNDRNSKGGDNSGQKFRNDR